MVYRTGSPGHKRALPVNARLQEFRCGSSLLPGLRRDPQLPAPDQHHQPERFARLSAGHPRPACRGAAGPDLRRLIQLLVSISLALAPLAPKADRTSLIPSQPETRPVIPCPAPHPNRSAVPGPISQMTLPVPGYRRPSISSRWHLPHISASRPCWRPAS